MWHERQGTRAALRQALALLCGLAGLPALGDDPAGVDDPLRARTNYMLNCQGCHGADGAGNAAAEVPRMKDFVGNFLRVPGGREFMVRVPGSANAALSDAELAELLNWLLPRISPDEMPADFVPYDASEVARLRRVPETDVAGRRAALIEAMASGRASQ